MTNSKIVVLSDLHLWGPEDPLYRALLKLIDEQLNQNDKFFIVGDLFDLFIGGKKVFIDRYSELINKIRALDRKNVEVLYIEGNHDFHLENVFDDCPHVKLYADSLHYEWNGKKFLFCHGDKINWKDIGYQFFRFATRNILTQCLIEAVPGKVVDKVGSTLSKASRGYHPEANNQTVRLFRNYACEQISNGYDYVILGHSHYMDEMRFRVDQHEGQYVNVGYPRKDRKFLQISSRESFFSLHSWDDLVIPTRRI